MKVISDRAPFLANRRDAVPLSGQTGSVVMLGTASSVLCPPWEQLLLYQAVVPGALVEGTASSLLAATVLG